MWLLGRLAPDHKTIADFRKDNGLALRKVCARFVELCREMGLPANPSDVSACLQFGRYRVKSGRHADLAL
jgi:hypothetical protein